MKALPYIAITTFIAGLAMLVVGYTYSRGGGGVQAAPSVTPIPIVLNTPTPLPTEAPTPTATPTPYDGTPTRFAIPQFKVDAAIESIGVLPNNQLATPTNPRDVGWYDIYKKPGFVGNAVFAAHVNWYGLDQNLMPFNKLDKMNPGDEIDVAMDNGLTYKYEFIGRYVYSVKNIAMGDIIDGKFADPTGQNPTVVMSPGEQWITLITCDAAGDYEYVNGNSGPVEYLDRTIVVAKRVA